MLKRKCLIMCFLALCLTATLALSSTPIQGWQPRIYVIGAVGDTCGTHLPSNNPQRHQWDDVADLLYEMGLDRFLHLGDAQHEDGLLEDYLAYYDVYFSKLLNITCPVAGNHDYYWSGWPWNETNNPHSTSNGSGYFGYFGEIAHPPYGFYSFDLGSWHIIALNSVLQAKSNYSEKGTPAYEQYEWLKKDLADHPNKKYPGTLAFMHHPLFDWEVPFYPHDGEWLKPLWDLLYANGVDVVLSGHSHTYQRWEPQDPDGNYDPNGIRQFVVGTGGYYLNELGHPPEPDNFVYGQDTSFGVLRMTLYEGSYDFEYVTIDGQILDAEYRVTCK